MSSDPMPRVLVELEDRLRGRPVDRPTPGLRDSVLRAAADSTLPVRSSYAGPWKAWYWAAIAAGVLIVLNLSMISASQDELSVLPARSLDQVAAEIQALQALEAHQEGAFR
jgi:hypothetical protein